MSILTSRQCEEFAGYFLKAVTRSAFMKGKAVLLAFVLTFPGAVERRSKRSVLIKTRSSFVLSLFASRDMSRVRLSRQSCYGERPETSVKNKELPTS